MLTTQEQHDLMRKASGSVTDERKLVGFLYTLARDHLTTGQLEAIMEQVEIPGRWEFTNGWLAKWAQHVAERLE